ncbi:choice-of-anchor J domain-containing protein [Pseudofulvimonas gallinarii]|jgi:hypothetical protein|uniref:Polysaccharide lyase-like protein n=1 Tax=Pseudofulvimonas gallinarii TaxID=634155 RepID=A0A4R3LJY5_9GAMM|nr:choice-of-anchor J domain-containing protein [Pseudofulvimonas gallinarii]TCS98844.1 hypothetical protein EDC25_10741 [Pseudofulvimonas gallinarii]
MKFGMGFLVLAATVLPGMVGAQERGACQEDFASVPQLPQRGWIFRNNSSPIGSTGWFQGIPARFTAHGGASNSYLSADKDNAGGSFPVLSNWAITPVMRFQPGLSLSFYTRSAGGAGSAADRLQVLYCQRGPGVSCKDPGSESGSMNHFNELMWVNVNADAGGYPTAWTAYTVGAAQGLPTSGSGRIAFRYYNLWQNPNDWGSTIGIDTVSVQGGSGCTFGDTIFYNGLQAS